MWSQLESSFSLIPEGSLQHGLLHRVTLPTPPFSEAKGPFVPLHQSVIGCGPHPEAKELLNFPGNSRIGNSHLAKSNSPEKEAAVSH